ncbi:hypothetical protein [Methanocella conradii]|uniref:hypothetical protein n=1 Tax=Methanocella conradii TaxID=1175444 RepID=UPI0024B37CF1|nr:hypothetical protein [Methanocella conradii]MDI6895918.1 hypothetical protein [Methanocella conradii]
MSDALERLLGSAKKYWFMGALILIVLVALWYRMGVINSFVVPTYGNTMYHVGIERETILTGHYPRYELSYGGGFPNFYVPAYRLLISSMSVATGIDPMVMSGLMTITIAIFVLLAMFAVAYRLSCNLYVALFAAFFFLMSPEITIFTIRPLPELLGLFMVPFTLYFVIRRDWPIAAIGAAITALTHQMTLATLAAVIGAYMAFQLARAGWDFYRKKGGYKEPLSTALWCLMPIMAACITYGFWQLYTLGTISLSGIAQVVYREGNVVDLPLFLRTGVFVLPFFAIGVAYIASSMGNSKKAEGEYGCTITIDAALLMFAWAAITLLLTFNDKLGIHIFMDRFFTFFVQIAIIIAGFGMYALLDAIGLDVLKVKP